MPGLAPTDVQGTIRGAASAFELYLGGTPTGGLVIGGFVSAMVAVGPKFTADGVPATTNGDVSLFLVTLGPYVDFYPDPTTGFHVLGTLGFAQVGFSSSNGNGTSESLRSSGVGVGAGLGYDWWVGAEWSLGILGRFTYANTKREGLFTENVVAPAPLFSASFH